MEARGARKAGRLGRALSLYEGIIASEPSAAEPLGEYGEFSLSLCEGLGDVARLYERHCREFGLAQDETMEAVAGLPIGRAGWERALADLETANRLAPTEIRWKIQLPRALEGLGRRGEAIACRVALARDVPAEEANIIALARLLDLAGDPERAIAVFEDLRAARPERAALSVQLASLYSRAGREREATGLLATVEQAADGHDGQLRTPADRILPLVCLLAEAGPIPVPAPLAESVVKWGAAIGEELTHGIPAMLAKGYIDRLLDRTAEARSTFASAFAAADRMGAGGKSNLNATVSVALNRAAAWFVGERSVGISLLDIGIGAPPHRMALSHARHLRRSGHVFECLSHFWTAAGMETPMFRPCFFEYYRGYRIVAGDNMWHAIPVPAGYHLVLGGRIIGVPRPAHKYRRFVPHGIVRFVRQRLDSRSEELGQENSNSRERSRSTLRRVARQIRRGAFGLLGISAFTLLAVRGSRRAHSADDIFTAIDHEMTRRVPSQATPASPQKAVSD